MPLHSVFSTVLCSNHAAEKKVICNCNGRTTIDEMHQMPEEKPRPYYGQLRLLIQCTLGDYYARRHLGLHLLTHDKGYWRNKSELLDVHPWFGVAPLVIMWKGLGH